MKNPKVYCKDCYDKGYYTVATGGSTALGDFIGDKPFNVPFEIVKKPCKCRQKREKTTLSHCCKAPIEEMGWTINSENAVIPTCTKCYTLQSHVEDDKPVSNGYCRTVCLFCQDSGYFDGGYCMNCDEGKKKAGVYKYPVVTTTHGHIKEGKAVSCGKECDTDTELPRHLGIHSKDTWPEVFIGPEAKAYNAGYNAAIEEMNTNPTFSIEAVEAAKKSNFFCSCGKSKPLSGDPHCTHQDDLDRIRTELHGLHLIKYPKNIMVPDYSLCAEYVKAKIKSAQGITILEAIDYLNGAMLVSGHDEIIGLSKASDILRGMNKRLQDES